MPWLKCDTLNLPPDLISDDAVIVVDPRVTLWFELLTYTNDDPLVKDPPWTLSKVIVVILVIEVIPILAPLPLKEVTEDVTIPTTSPTSYPDPGLSITTPPPPTKTPSTGAIVRVNPDPDPVIG